MDNFYKENSEFIPKENKGALPTSKVKAGVMTYLPSVILTFILIAISAFGTLIQFRFQIQNIVWSAFFISLCLRLVSIFLSKYVGSNLYYNKTIVTDDVQRFKNDFIKEGKGIDKVEFDTYVREYNLRVKKKTYETKKRTKITKIDLKINGLLHKNDIYETRRRSEKIKALRKKKAEIEKICTKEYIDENIAYIRVKYPKVRSCYFLSPAEDSSDTKIRYNVNFSKSTTSEILKSLPLTICLVLFGALISYDAVMGNANVISILYDVGNMAFNFTLGWFVVGKKIIARTINAYINRLTFISGYKKNGATNNTKPQAQENSEGEGEKHVEVVTQECTE